MTKEEIKREEAIKGLEVLRRDFSGYKPNEEMFDMAIEALKQEPCEDAISRQAVLDCASTIETDDFSGNEIIEVVTVEEIKELPSVNPQELKTDTLDKIKAEIEAKCCITVGRENDGAITLHDVFEIIDKYKAESEDKE